MHLKLALESLKNPIPPVNLPQRQTSLASLAETVEPSSPDKENRSREGSPVFSETESEDDVWEDEEDDSTDMNEQEAHLMQDHMQDLLGDLSVFKRKLATDHERWQHNEQAASWKRRAALRQIAANNR